MSETLESLTASIGRWIREGTDVDMVADAVSDAIQDLYQGLLGVSSETYLGQEPRRLKAGDDDTAPIPFQDLMGCIPFIRYTALSLLGQSVYEDAAAVGWNERAEKARERVLLEALNKSDRPERIEPYDPYNQTSLNPNRRP
jgi:hypothetical protein